MNTPARRDRTKRPSPRDTGSDGPGRKCRQRVTRSARSTRCAGLRAPAVRISRIRPVMPALWQRIEWSASRQTSSRGRARYLELCLAMDERLRADIGVFGGSGFYSLMEDARETWIETPYGPPSDRVAIGEIEGKRIAFLPRHGNDHRFPPHLINYRANAYAMKSLGVRWIIGPTAAGSLSKAVVPGSMVVCDQLVDLTAGRSDTFYESPPVTHVGFADPYCPTLRPLAVDALRAIGVETHPTGTIVVISGPRFSTRAESKFY